MRLRSRTFVLFAAFSCFAIPPALAASSTTGPSVALTTPDATELVSIYRDSFGVPYIVATTDKGAYFGAGYAAASDRLFQMCLARLRYQGRVSEFFGPGSIDPASPPPQERNLNADWHARLTGISRLPRREATALQANDPTTYDLLQAYADGVNRAIADVNAGTLSKHRLFTSANWIPTPPVAWDIPLDPWTVTDCIGVWYVLSGPYAAPDSELANQAVVNANPGVPLVNLLPQIIGTGKCDDQAAVIDQNDASLPNQMLSYVSAFQAQLGLPSNIPVTVCSNGVLPHLSHTWAVRGTRITTGKAVLVAEPRLGLTMPSTLYEWRMTSASGLDVRGAGVPGSPNMLVGATDKVAWGASALGLDQSDLFMVNVNIGNGTYQLNGQTLPFEVSIDAQIKVRDMTTGGFQAPLVANYRECYWGPLVSDVLGTAKIVDTQGNGMQYALKAIPFSCGTGGNSPSATTAPVSTSAASRRMYKAQNVVGLRDSLDTWAVPSLNIVFADSNGDIGYLAAGQHPVRSQSSILAGRIPLDGTVTSSDWIALTTNLAKPWVINPAAGYIACANHTPVGGWYPMCHFWGSVGESDRSRRLRESLSALLPTPTSPPVTPAAVGDLRNDVVVPALRDLVTVARYVRLNQSSTFTFSAEATTALVTYLEPWVAVGARMDGSDPSATLATFIDLTIRKIDLTAIPLPDYGTSTSGLEYMLKKRIIDIATPGFTLPVAECQLLDKRLKDAWNFIQNGSSTLPVPPPTNPSQWPAWYTANELTRSIQPYADLGPADPFTGPVSVEGPAPAVHVATIVSAFGACYSYWMQVGDTSTYDSRLPMGESDRGPHATDQRALWLHNTNQLTGPNAGLKAVIPGTPSGTPVTLVY